MQTIPKLSRSRFAPALFAAATLIIAAGAAPANSQQAVTPPTQAECQSAWDDSSASDTCGAGVVSPTYGSLDAATVTVWIERKWIFDRLTGEERS